MWSMLLVHYLPSFLASYIHIILGNPWALEHWKRQHQKLKIRRFLALSLFWQVGYLIVLHWWTRHETPINVINVAFLVPLIELFALLTLFKTFRRLKHIYMFHKKNIKVWGKHCKSAKLPWHHNTKLSFCLFLDITLMKCLKGLEFQKSLFVSKFKWHSLATKGRYRADMTGRLKHLIEFQIQIQIDRHTKYIGWPLHLSPLLFQRGSGRNWSSWTIS